MKFSQRGLGFIIICIASFATAFIGLTKQLHTVQKEIYKLINNQTPKKEYTSEQLQGLFNSQK